MKAYTTLTGISKLSNMVIEGQNQSATFRISIIPTYANRYNPFTVQSLNPDIASVRASGADTYTVTSRAIWRIDGVAQSGRTGTVDCDNELHNIQFNGV